MFSVSIFNPSLPCCHQWGVSVTGESHRIFYLFSWIINKIWAMSQFLYHYFGWEAKQLDNCLDFQISIWVISVKRNLVVRFVIELLCKNKGEGLPSQIPFFSVVLTFYSSSGSAEDTSLLPAWGSGEYA